MEFFKLKQKIVYNIKKMISKKIVIDFVWICARTVLMTGLAFIILYPIIYMVSIAIRPVRELFDPSIVWIPKSVTMDNIKVAFESLGLSRALGKNNTIVNTLSLDAVSSFLQVASTALVGYGFARFTFFSKKFLFGLVLLTMIVPINNIIIPTYLNYSNIHLIDNYLSFYIPAIFGMGIRSGLCIFIFRQFFRNMPRELEDAASIDGCGSFGTFFRVFLPNATPGVLTAFIFSFVWYWNDFYYSTMFFPGKQTLSIALSGLASVLNQNLSIGRDPYVILAIMQAGCLLAILPLLLFYIFMQKYFTESIERTGIVG